MHYEEFNKRILLDVSRALHTDNNERACVKIDISSLLTRRLTLFDGKVNPFLTEGSTLFDERVNLFEKQSTILIKTVDPFVDRLSFRNLKERMCLF